LIAGRAEPRLVAAAGPLFPILIMRGRIPRAFALGKLVMEALCPIVSWLSSSVAPWASRSASPADFASSRPIPNFAGWKGPCSRASAA
jgi:hypothetical protein